MLGAAGRQLDRAIFADSARRAEEWRLPRPKGSAMSVGDDVDMPAKVRGRGACCGWFDFEAYLRYDAGRTG